MHESCQYPGCAPSSTACDGKELVQRLENRVNVLINALETEMLPDGFASLDQVNSEAFILIQIVQIAVSEVDIGFMLRAPLLTYIENFDIAPLEELLSTRSSNESDDNDVGDEDTDTDTNTNTDTDTDTEDATALFAVLCADDVERPTAESLVDLLPRMNAVSDFFAEANLSVAAYCSGWQPALSPLEPITTNVAPQALLIGGTADARTPIEMLSEMSAAIGGVAVTSDHIGHTVVFQGSSRCVDELVVAFLTEGVLPTQLSCPFEE